MGSNSPNPSPRVLVVDDRPASLLALEAELEGLGASVTRALSGEAALQLANDADFALILLDVQLPKMNGIEVARRLRSRERTAQTPIIFVTAYDQDDRDVLAAYALEAVDFLFKPLRPEVLRAKVTVFINLSRQAALIREHERREHARTLEAARHAWEEEALRRERDQLAELDRKKDRFLAMIGHELRTPLSPLLTGLEVLKERFERDPQADERVVRLRDVMHRQVEHLIQLVEDLLDVSRINSDKLRLSTGKLRMQDVIEHAVATSRPLIEQKAHTVILDIREQPLVVQGDLVRLVQIVANLLSNAARYTPQGGKIRVSCSAVDGQFELRVADNGVGIEKEALSRIFEPFVQEDRHRSAGLGLGLAIVQRLVLLHGGTVTAHSDGPGLGSDFVVRLPLVPNATNVADTALATPTET